MGRFPKGAPRREWPMGDCAGSLTEWKLERRRRKGAAAPESELPAVVVWSRPPLLNDLSRLAVKNTDWVTLGTVGLGLVGLRIPSIFTMLFIMASGS